MAQQHLGRCPGYNVIRLCSLHTYWVWPPTWGRRGRGGRGAGRGHHTVPDISKHTPLAQTQELVGT